MTVNHIMERLYELQDSYTQCRRIAHELDLTDQFKWKLEVVEDLLEFIRSENSNLRPYED